MELLARTRKRWLSQWIDLSEGVPSAQTLARVFSLIEPAAFERCLVEWSRNVIYPMGALKRQRVTLSPQSRMKNTEKCPRRFASIGPLKMAYITNWMWE